MAAGWLHILSLKRKDSPRLHRTPSEATPASSSYLLTLARAGAGAGAGSNHILPSLGIERNVAARRL